MEGTGIHQIDDPIPLSTEHAQRPMSITTRSMYHVPTYAYMYYVVQYFTQNMIGSSKYFSHYHNVNTYNWVHTSRGQAKGAPCL